MARIEALPTLRCAACDRDFSRLVDGRVCYDCYDRENAKKAAARRRDQYLVSLLGARSAHDCTFERFEARAGTEKAFRACEAFNPATDNLYLWGACGRGKTHLAKAALRKAVLAGARGWFGTLRELAAEFRGKDSVEEAEAFRRFTHLDILVLDDIGSGKESDFTVNDVLCGILNRRWDAYKNGVIITSNLSLADLSRKLCDDRPVSRINGICTAIGLVAEGDYRAKPHRSGQQQAKEAGR